jgi:hypothetical protein
MAEKPQNIWLQRLLRFSHFGPMRLKPEIVEVARGILGVVGSTDDDFEESVWGTYTICSPS